MVRLLALVTAVALAAACSAAAKPPEPVRQVKLAARIGSFNIENGVRGVVASEPSAKNAVAVMRIQVGSTADPAGKAGLAHLVEHLVFQLRAGEATLAEHLADAVLGYNAQTHYDHTTYFAVASPDKLATVLGVYAEIVSGSCQALSDEQFEREREVVRNEIRANRSGRGGDFFAILSEAAFPPGHPYRRTVGGDDQQLISITRDDVCKFLADHYSPDNVVLSISGRVTDQQVGAALNTSFARIPRRSAAGRAAIPAVPDSQVGKVLRSQTDVDLPYAVALFRMPADGTPERVAAEMMMGYARSRTAGFADEYEFATAVFPVSIGGDGALLRGVAVQLRSPGDADEALDAIWRAFGKADKYFSELQFHRAKSLRQYSVVAGYDEPVRRGRELADYHARGAKEYFFGDLAVIDAVTRDQARATAARVFVRGNAVSLVITPDQTAERRYRRAAPSLDAAPAHDGARAVAIDPAEARRPLVIAADSATLDHREIELGNGMRVLLAPTTVAPVVRLYLIVGSGRAAEPAGKSGIAEIATDFLRVNFSRTAAVEIRAAYAFHQHGGQFATNVTDDFTVFSAHGLEMYIDHLIAGFERQIRTGTYDQEEIERFLRARRIELSTPGSRERFVSEQALYARTFGDDHPYATRGFWLAKDLENLGRDAANSWRERHFVGANSTLIVTGKFDPDLVEKHIRYHFEPWPRGKAGTAVTAAAARRGGKSPLAIGVAGANAENLSVRVTFPLPAGVSPAHARLLVAAEMVGQQVSSIREEMGASYGFGASLVLNKGPGMLRVSGSVDAPRAGAALTSLLAGLDGLRQGGEDFDINFVIARREVVRQLMADAESSGAVATRLAFVVRHGLPLNYHRKLAAEVARLTSADVRAAIAEHLPPGEARVLLVGARPQLEAAFAGAGFAVDQVDWVE